MKEGKIMQRDKEWIRERMRRDGNTKKSGQGWMEWGGGEKEREKENVYDSQMMNGLHQQLQLHMLMTLDSSQG